MKIRKFEFSVTLPIPGPYIVQAELTFYNFTNILSINKAESKKILNSTNHPNYFISKLIEWTNFSTLWVDFNKKQNGFWYWSGNSQICIMLDEQKVYNIRKE